MDLGTRLREEGQVALLAAQFLTRLPISTDYSPERMACTPRWYPGVGLALGVLLAGVLWAGTLIWPMPLAVVFAVAVGVFVTGALHEDGLADLCDGLGGGATRERALEIMRDSQIGAFGALGLVFLIGAKILALAALPLPLAMAALVVAHAGSRVAMVWVMTKDTYARAEGAGTTVAGGVDHAGRPVAAGLTVLAAVPLLLLSPMAAVLGAVGLALSAMLLRRWFVRRLGGYTGDCLGATQQTAEVGFYLGVAAWV